MLRTNREIHLLFSLRKTPVTLSIYKTIDRQYRVSITSPNRAFVFSIAVDLTELLDDYTLGFDDGATLNLLPVKEVDLLVRTMERVLECLSEHALLFTDVVKINRSPLPLALLHRVLHGYKGRSIMRNRLIAQVVTDLTYARRPYQVGPGAFQARRERW
jgi:hypothetical protein